MYKAFTCFLCFVLFSLSGPAPAQDNSLQFHAVRLPGRFPGAGIRMALQDKTGLLWYITNDGLYRYDGDELLFFGRKTTPALPSLPVYFFQADGRGNLWLGFNNGAAKFDLKKWTITPLYTDRRHRYRPLDKNMSAIACLHGKVYFGSRGGKLYVVSNGRLRKVADISMPITNILEPVPGELWLATDEGVLVNIVVSKGVYGMPYYFKPEATAGKAIYKICCAAPGKLLFTAGTSGLFEADLRVLYARRNGALHDPGGAVMRGLVSPVAPPPGGLDFFSSPFSIADRQAAVMTGGAEQPKNIYIFNFVTDSWRLATPSPVKFPGRIFYVSKYPSGAYVCSFGGLTSMRFYNPPITPLLNSYDNKNSIRSVYKQGHLLYIGSYLNGFVCYNELTRKVKRLAPDLYVYSMLPWTADSLLLADEGKGLFWYRPRANSLAAVPFKDLRGYDTRDNFATVLCRVNDSLVLEGTYQGVQLVDPVRGIRYPVFSDSLSEIMQSAKTNAILPFTGGAGPASGKYLVATANGVFKADIESGRVRYFFDDQVSPETRHMTVFSLLQLNGQTWMGSGGFGVLASDSSGRLIPMQWLNDRLTGQMAYSLTRCGNDVLIGTNKGLNVLHLADSSFSYYTAYHGLPAGEFNQAAVFSDNEQAYLGTVNGLVHWDRHAAAVIPLDTPFHVRINKLVISEGNNHNRVFYRYPYLPLDSQYITVPPGAGYFSVAFGKPDDNEQQLDYYYRLQSVGSWTALGSRRQITFVKMPPGRYELQFAVRTPGGTWIEDAHRIPLAILPAFYQTWWFKLLLCLVVAGLLCLVLRYREVQKNKERSLRMKIAGDLHDEVGSALATIWHQIRRILEHLSPQAETVSKPLRTVADLSGDALSVMNDIVWSIDARFDTMEELVLRMKDYVYKLQNDLDIPVKLEVTGRYQKRKLSQIIRQNLFLLFKEAVNNAMKHGNGDVIAISMHFDEKLKMQICNSFATGEGQHNTTAQGGRGLQIMNRRAAGMNGNLEVKQEGDKFVVNVVV